MMRKKAKLTDTFKTKRRISQLPSACLRSKGPTKKESVAECLRRYREEEAKARRAAQMRKNYTLLSDEPEVEETASRAALPKETGPKVVDKKSAKREEIQ